MERFELELRHEHAGTAVLVRGELDIASRTALTEAVLLLVADGCRRVVLDLESMAFCDLCGLGGLEAAAQVMRGASGELALRHVPPQLDALLAAVPPRTPLPCIDAPPGAGPPGARPGGRHGAPPREQGAVTRRGWRTGEAV